MKIYMITVSKEIDWNRDGSSSEIAHIRWRTMFGFSEELEIDKDAYNLIGKTMGWSK